MKRFIFDILGGPVNAIQNSRLNDAANDSANTSSTVIDSRIRIDRLVLLSQAMWELLGERAGLTEEDLIRKALEVDARDGKIDGRRSGNLTTCKGCERVVAVGRTLCPYCTAPIVPSFENI